VHNLITNDLTDVVSDIGTGLTDIAGGMLNVTNNIGQVPTDVAKS